MMRSETIKYFDEIEWKNFTNALEDYRIEMGWNKKHLDYHIAVRNEAMYQIMYYCALRVSEVTKLKVTSFNSIRNEIYCERVKGGQNNTLKILDPKILNLLKRHLKVNKPSHFLFEPFKKNNPMLSRKTLDYWIKFYCQLAKIPNKELHHCHTLRHTRAIMLANSNLDIREIQYWLGHSDIKNTEVYLQFTTQQQFAMYYKLKMKGIKE